MTERTIGRRVAGTCGLAAAAAAALLSVAPVDANAQAFVTGSGSTDGFSMVGWVRDLGDGRGKGQFTIVLHRDSVDGTTVAAVCHYRNFDLVQIRDGVASFHSIGECEALSDNDRRVRFTSDNVFGIADHGQPGPGLDTIDVNIISGTGLAVPGAFLVDGNFIVRQ
jgi:hypothetical protein